MPRKSVRPDATGAKAPSKAGQGRRRPNATTQKIQRTSSSTPARKTVTFKLHAPDAQIVDIAGSFNNWTLKPMKRGKNGTWTATFRPLPGIYEYKFLIDHRWVEDPGHHDKTSDGHGGFNSVCRAE